MHMPRQTLKMILSLIKSLSGRGGGVRCANTTPTEQVKKGSARSQWEGWVPLQAFHTGNSNHHSTDKKGSLELCKRCTVLKQLQYWILQPAWKAYTETRCGNTFTYCVKIWEESNSRAAVHREGHKGFDIQGRLHHQGRCAHKGGKCSSACQEQTKPGIHSILLSTSHTA